MAFTLPYLPHVKGSDVTNEMLTKMRTDQSFDDCSPGWRTDDPKKATRSGQGYSPTSPSPSAVPDFGHCTPLNLMPFSLMIIYQLLCSPSYLRTLV